MHIKRQALTLSLLIMLFSLAGCVADDPNDSGGLSSVEQDGTCFALLQTSIESMDAPGNLMVDVNYSYNADCRVAGIESRGGWAFSNTTYDTDGHPVVIITTTSIDGGATWTSIDTNQTWVNGFMTVSETMGTETNYTYDADGRVTVQETLHRNYVNTTYDAVHGEIAVIETALTVDGGANWVVYRTHHTWGNP